MNGIIGAALVPHPPIILPALGGTGRHELSSIRQAFGELRHWIDEMNPDVVLLVSPHGPMKPDKLPMHVGDILSGNLLTFGIRNFDFEAELDADLSQALLRRARERDMSYLVTSDEPADHGISVPIAMLHLEHPLVVFGYPDLPHQDLLILGQEIDEALRFSGRRGIFIASGDLSHCLSRDAPAGFDRVGREYDRFVVEALKEGCWEALAGASENWVHRASQCAHQPILLAFSALATSNVATQVYAYAAPYGVGYALASWSLQVGPVELARAVLRHHFQEPGPFCMPPQLMKALEEPAGAFVSLYRSGQLRGCMGTLHPTTPNAANEVATNALRAARDDPRFPALTSDEMEELEISVDLLGPLERVAAVNALHPKRYGVVVRQGRTQALLLPDLPGIESPTDQYSLACQKAGIDPQSPGVVLERFEVRRFAETNR